MGYLITATEIHSGDWKTPANDSIVENVVTSLQDSRVSRRGTSLQDSDAHVIVFHDAGGDRHKTVDALNKLIPQLLVQGYQFVGIDDLLDVEKSRLMPPITDLEQFLAFSRRIIGWFRVWGLELLLGLFFVTTAMSIARISHLGAASCARQVQCEQAAGDGLHSRCPVCIPAHNEAKVIAQTLEAVLKSDYSRLRVTVIDDGSTDDTRRIVKECAKADSRTFP